MTQALVGVIGGSGLYQMDALEGAQEQMMKTPFGAPSDVLVTGRVHGVPVVFLARHARGHKLVWNRTGNRHVRVRCRLRVPAIVRMQRRHGLLLLLTLGLYWPWAQIQARRVRLNATVLQTRVGVAVLAAHWPVK